MTEPVVLPATRAIPLEERRPTVRALAGVSLVYLAMQLVLLPLGRWWSWDEAISVSQVARGVVAADFDPWRFRGVSLIVAPPTLLGAPSAVIRLWLAAASALALFVAFRTWIPTLRRAAPVAALIFASSWTTLYYGSEAMPNLWSAFCGIAAVGASTREERSATPAMAALAAMALFRLPDAIVLSTVIAVAAVVASRPAREALAPLLGAATGGLIWAVDVGIRFGLPGALRIAVESQRSERLVTVTGPARRLLASFGWVGTNIPPTAFQPASWSILTWGLVAGIAMVAARRHAGPVRIAVVGALALALPYVALVGPIVPRYLLPAFGLLAVGASVGAPDVGSWMGPLSGRLARRVVGGAAVAVTLGLLLANLAGARGAAQDVVEERATDRTVGEWVTRVLGDPPPGSCSLLVVGNAPAVGMATPCRTRLFFPPGDAYRGQSDSYLRRAVEAAEGGGDTYIVRIWPGPPPQGVTLEPVAGSDLATLYRLLPIGG